MRSCVMGDSLDITHLQLHLPDLTVTRMVTTSISEPSSRSP
ncbi:MAG: hypothetical protein R3E97_07640 [Candidatus Eisenbacteria bacterium]